MNHTTTYPPKFPLPAMGGYRYFFNGQEADNEVLGEGVSLTAEFWQYDSRLGRRWNVDPVFKEYESPYACFAGNPVWFADRFGMDIGWVKDSDGKVFWDKNTNSLEDFNLNYADKVGFQYVSDIDDYNSYSLPNGDGKLIMNRWEGPSEVKDGCASAWLKISFVPADKSAIGGWMQTYSSNLPDDDSGNYTESIPSSTTLFERVDAQTVEYNKDPYYADFFRTPPSLTLDDMPVRKRNEESLFDVSMIMQSTLILNNQKSISLRWGFVITGENSAITISPTIIEENTDFHNSAIDAVILK